MRIANASEAMAQNHIQLQRDHDFYKKRYEETLQRNGELQQQLITQRGMVTRYKNKANVFHRILQKIMDRPHIAGEYGEKFKEGDVETGHDAGTYSSAYNYSLELVKFEIRKHTKIR